MDVAEGWGLGCPGPRPKLRWKGEVQEQWGLGCLRGWNSGEFGYLVPPQKAPACIQDHATDQTTRKKSRRERLLMILPKKLWAGRSTACCAPWRSLCREKVNRFSHTTGMETRGFMVQQGQRLGIHGSLGQLPEQPRIGPMQSRWR